MFTKLEYKLPTGQWVSIYKRPNWFNWIMNKAAGEGFVIELFGKLWVDPIVDLQYWADTHHPVLYHELVHAQQQEICGEFRWYYKYVTSKNFRLDAEAEAYAEQLLKTSPAIRPTLLEEIAKWLAGPSYRYCAPDVETAKAIIIKYMGGMNDL
ncbi:MAG: hypothetical protein MZV70_29215 [Desulfobacterales bacterium]|nr:hypothetical protein [Desulfobacterales bacterium]